MLTVNGQTSAITSPNVNDQPIDKSNQHPITRIYIGNESSVVCSSSSSSNSSSDSSGSGNSRYSWTSQMNVNLTESTELRGGGRNGIWYQDGQAVGISTWSEAFLVVDSDVVGFGCSISGESSDNGRIIPALGGRFVALPARRVNTVRIIAKSDARSAHHQIRTSTLFHP